MAMEEIKNVCRICLKFGDELCSDSSDLSLREKLKSLVPRVNVNNPSDFIICSRCRRLLEDGYQFAQTFSKTNELIQNEKKRLNIVTGINLNHIVNKYKLSGSVNKNMNGYVCRFCLSSNIGKFSKFRKGYKCLNLVLDMFMFKMDEDLTLESVICERCHKEVRKLYVFVNKCMHVEQKSVEYLQESTEKQIDLNKFKDFFDKQKLKKHLVKVMSVGDKESKEVSNYNLQNTDNNKKRSLPEEGSDVVSRKKQKFSMDKDTTTASQTWAKSNRCKDNGLPHFGFTRKFLRSPKNFWVFKEWLSLANKLKIRNNWTDLTTINNVLEKLEGIDEIHNYFNNIAKTSKWEEWKNKLIKIFPSQNDYCTLLYNSYYRRMQPNETFVDYYHVKMNLLNTINVTGESAVSCLLGGLADKVIACVGRAGNYKNPEELLLYFKTCDEKEGLTKSKPQKKQMKCHWCKKSSHPTRECRIGLGGRNMDTVRPKMIQTRKPIYTRGEKRSYMLWRLCQEAEDRNEEVTIDIGESDRVLRSSAPSQIQSEQTSSSIATQEADNRDVSNIKQRENIVVTNTSSKISSSTTQEKGVMIQSDEHLVLPDKPTSTATLSKQTEYKNETVKQDQNEGKNMCSTTAERQSDNGTCSVKPQPSKSTSDVIFQGKGSNLIKPYAQEEVRAGGASTPKQGDTYVTQKPQSKENVHNSSGKTQAWSKESPVNRDASSTRPKSHGEMSNKGTSAAYKEDNKSTKYGSKSQNWSKERQKPPNKESSFSRDMSSTRPWGYNETSKTAAITQEWRKEDSSNLYGSKWQDWSENSAALQTQKQGINLVKSQAPTERSNLNSGTFGSQKESGHRNTYDITSLAQRAKDYAKSHMSGAFLQDWKENTYSSSDVSSAKLQRDIEKSYVNKDTYVATVQDWRKEDYYSTVRSIASEESYLDRVSSGRSQSQYEESDVNRAPSSIRPDKERDAGYISRGTFNVRPEESPGSYAMRNLFNARFQERGDPSVIQEVEMNYTQRIRPQESEGDINKSISNERWREEEGHKERYDSRGLRTRSPMRGEAGNVFRGPLGSRQRENEVDFVNQNIYSNQWREDKEQRGRYDNTAILMDRSPMHDEEGNVPSSSRLQEIEGDTVIPNISSDRWRQDEEGEGRYANKYIIRGGSPVRSPSHAKLRGIEGNKVNMRVSSDRWREIEQEERYFNREGILRSSSSMRDEGPLSARPQEIEIDTVYQNISSDKEWGEKYVNRSIMRTRSPMRSQSHSRQQESNDGWCEERYVNRKDIFKTRSPMQDERLTDRGPSGDRLQEIETDNVNQSIFSDRWREGEEQEGRYVNKGSLGGGPQGGNGSNVYRATLRTGSPVQDETCNVNRMSSGARPTGEWESSYVDRNITGVRHGEHDKEDNMNIAARSVRLSAGKEMFGTGLKSEELMERTFSNKDESCARPSDVNHPRRAAPTDSSRKSSEGSYLNRPTPSETLPGYGEGDYFNKSISSTRLLGSSLGSLFSSSLASRPFTSHPSHVTTVKPLALNQGSDFSRDVREYSYNHRNNCASGEIKSQRGQELVRNNYFGGSSTVKHQEQSHRDMCLKCYTIGHKSKDCPQFRT